MSTITLNGRPPRKQLADQLDRLDSIIDALAEGLPGAVADACREGARAAVKDAIIEVLTNPELRALIAPPPVPAAPMPAASPTAVPFAPPERKPGLWSRLKAKLTAAKAAVLGGAVNAKQAVAGRYNAVRDTVAAVGNAAGERVPVRQISFIALGVGLVVGLSCLLAPHAVAAAVGAASAASTAVAVQTGSWLKRAARRLGMLA